MKQANLFFLIFLIILLAVPICYSQNTDRPCTEDEICDGVIINGICSGTCTAKGETSCSLLDFSAECIIGSLVNKLKASFEEFLNKSFLFILDFNVNAKGNEKLWQFSYSISFLIAVFLLSVTSISYFKEALLDNSSVELLNSYKAQFIRFIFMLIFLAGCSYIASLVTEGFYIFNLEILKAMDFNLIESFVSVILASLIILLPIIYLSLGAGLAVYIGVIVTFFVIAALRIIILYPLLSVMPIAIVLCHFESTKPIGNTLIRFVFSHFIILTVWVVVFAVANDAMEGIIIVSNIAQGFFLLAAFLINSVLYFKINSFFAALEFAPKKARTVVERGVTNERVVVLREKIFGKSLYNGQKSLIKYVK
ncbi:MAG: hypothetical protein V1859_02230 [archaeon]